MMDIKFRGKTIDIKEWIYGNLIQNDDFTFIVGKVEYSSVGYCCDCDRPYSDQWIVDPKTVGQYTGLKDKNGKEIYEGDIVKFIDEYSCETECGIEYDEFENTGYIFYDKDTLAFDITGRNTDREDILDFDLEVIGNVYENSELLGDDVNV